MCACAKEQTGLSFLLVSAQYLPHLGGVENYTHAVAKELLRKGNCVTVVTTTPEGKEEAPGADMPVIRMPSAAFLHGRYPLLRRNREFREAVSRLDRKHFDAVVIQTRFYPLSVWGARYARKRGICPLVIEHGSAPLKMGGAAVSAGVRMVERFMTVLLLRTKPRFVGVSEAANDWLEKGFHVRSEGVVSNCVDHAAVDAIPARLPPMKEEIPPGTRTLFFAGRLTAEKGLPPLIDAAKDLDRELPLRLLIAGDGDLKEMVQRTGEPICYVGKLSFEQVIGAIKACDVFCFPSVQPEGLPTSLLEAGSCGAVVVSSQAGGSGEVVRDELTGYLLSESGSGAIEAALRSALTDPKAEERGKRLQSFVRTRFTWDRTAETLLSVCRKLQRE